MEKRIKLACWVFSVLLFFAGCSGPAGEKTPSNYEQLRGLIGKPVEEVLFLDDNFNADLTAKQAGMKVCGVYDESSKDYVNQMKEITDAYIYDFSELLTLQP